MGDNYKKKFKKDVDSILQYNLNFDQIKDKIIIDDSNKKYREKGRFLNKHHTHNRGFKFNWKVLSVATSILLIFSVSLIYFTTQNKNNYKLSPFNTKLQGAVFGKQSLNFDSPLNLSELIDNQHSNVNPTYFYEVDAKGSDNFYTCAYFPTKYINILSNMISYYVNSFMYFDHIDMIDGKLIAAYQDYFLKNKLDQKESVKWYQISSKDKIPHQIKDYSLGLVLGSQDVHFLTNKTTNEKLDITKKIFYRNFYNIKDGIFDNQHNIQGFLIDMKDKNMLLSEILINNDTFSFREIIFERQYKIIENNIELVLYSNNRERLGHYKTELESIKIEEYYKDNTLYATYNYIQFCNMYFNH